MNKLIQLINIDTQEVIFEETIDSTNSLRISMLQTHIEHEKIMNNINLQYKDYELDDNGNKIEPVMQND
jgi:hypothetical protein